MPVKTQLGHKTGTNNRQKTHTVSLVYRSASCYIVSSNSTPLRILKLFSIFFFDTFTIFRMSEIVRISTTFESWPNTNNKNNNNNKKIIVILRPRFLAVKSTKLQP